MDVSCPAILAITNLRIQQRIASQCIFSYRFLVSSIFFSWRRISVSSPAFEVS